MLEVYRAHLCEALDRDLAPPPNPFDDAEMFVTWLQASDFPRELGVSRYLRQVYLSRPDLSRAFPEVPGRDTEAFYQWAHDHGRKEMAIPALFVPPVSSARATTRFFDRPSANGVNLAGFLEEALGIGEVARRIVHSLTQANVHVDAVPIRRENIGASDTTVTVARHPINIVCINPDSLAWFAQREGRELLNKRFTVGVWFWETAQLPPSYGWAFELVDEVWCASDFVLEAVKSRAHDRVPVWKFPLAIVAPDINDEITRTHLGLPEDRFVFLHSFDYLSVVERKNPIGAIEAYRRAFGPGDGTTLVVKSINAKARPDDHAAVRYAARGREDILLIDALLDARQNASMIARADCFVSLHRSEGFGLNLADALALGRPVVATAYGGNVEFMTGLEEWLVPYDLVAVGEGHHPYPSDAQWAEPDLAVASTRMQAIVSDPATAAAKAGTVGAALMQGFSPARAGERLAEHLRDGQRQERPRRALWRRH
jgi:glycosyltransferase involved in cell wall biosynthesis